MKKGTEKLRPDPVSTTENGLQSFPPGREAYLNEWPRIQMDSGWRCARGGNQVGLRRNLNHQRRMHV